MRWSLACVLVPSLAAAGPLEPLWEVPFSGDCDSSMFALDGQLAMLHGSDLVPVDRKTGKLGKPRKLHTSKPNVQHGGSWGLRGMAEVLDGVLVVHGGGWIGGFDPKTGDELWIVEPNTTALEVPRPRQTAVVVERTTRLDHGDFGVTLEVVDTHTGKSRGQVALHGRPAQQQPYLTADATRLYAVTTPEIFKRRWFLTAIELATAKLAWTLELVAPADGGLGILATDSGLLVDVAGEGMRGRAVEHGKELRRIATPPNVGVVAAGNRLLFELLPSQPNMHAIEAYDFATGNKLWTTTTGEFRFAVASSFALAEVGDEVHAIDLATGADIDTWTMADQELIYVQDDASAPMAVRCGGGRLVALDPSAPPRALEHATIDATITCRGCNRTVPPPNKVVIDGRSVPLVDHHAHATIDGRGQIHVSSEPSDTSAVSAGIGWEVRRCDRTIVLTGKRHYTVKCTIEVSENHF